MKKIYTVLKKSPVFCMAFMLMAISFLTVENLQAQNSEKYHFGLRGGIGMSTFSGFKNNGLKVGFTGGVYFDYDIKTNNILTAELYYSTGGQQSEKWLENNDEKVKIYNKYNLHYLNLPLIYQYYFTDILGIETGLNFRYCMSGQLKTQIGNNGWNKAQIEYNDFDFGLIFGIYTDNLIPHDNFFVSLRAYFGFLDVVKDVGSNKNVSVQVGVGYMIF